MLRRGPGRGGRRHRPRARRRSDPTPSCRSGSPARATSSPDRSCSAPRRSTATSSTALARFRGSNESLPTRSSWPRPARALPAAVVLPIATSARVGGGHACCDVEAMEGFAVLRAAERRRSSGARAPRRLEQVRRRPRRLADRRCDRGPRSRRHGSARGVRCLSCPPPFRRQSARSASSSARRSAPTAPISGARSRSGFRSRLADQLSVHEPLRTQILIFWAVGPLVVAAYLWASAIVYELRPALDPVPRRPPDLCAVPDPAGRVLPAGDRLVRAHRPRRPGRARRASPIPSGARSAAGSSARQTTSTRSVRSPRS